MFHDYCRKHSCNSLCFIMEIVRKFFSHISGSVTAQDQYVFLSYTSSASLLHTSLVSRRILEKSQK